MAPPNELSRRGVGIARTMLLVSGSAALFFVVGFVWHLVGEEQTPLPVIFFLAAGVFLAAGILGLALSLLRLAGDPSVVKRGSELQSYGVKSAADPIVQLDDQLQIVAMNPAAERRFGHSQGSIRGMPLSLLVPQAPKKKKTPEELARAQAEENTAREPAEKLAKQLALRAGTRLAHLVQPMLGYTEIAMVSLDADHPVRIDLAEIGRASARVALLAQTLEVYGGADRRNLERLDLRRLVERVEADLRLALQPGAELQIQRAGANPLMLADAGLTRLTLLLLVCNAEDASPAGATIRVEANEGILTVTDAGSGMPEAANQNLEPWSSSLKDPERGVGLGLQAARQAMRLQGGELEIRPNPQGGTVVALKFADPGASSPTGEMPRLETV